jgi:hypothetical protein
MVGFPKLLPCSFQFKPRALTHFLFNGVTFLRASETKVYRFSRAVSYTVTPFANREVLLRGGFLPSLSAQI